MFLTDLAVQSIDGCVHAEVRLRSINVLTGEGDELQFERFELRIRFQQRQG